MAIKLAARNSIAGVRTFYVDASNPANEPYLVVEVKRDGKIIYYCNCGDFFGRKLPFIGTNLFSLCKHGQEVKDAVSK